MNVNEPLFLVLFELSIENATKLNWLYAQWTWQPWHDDFSTDARRVKVAGAVTSPLPELRHFIESFHCS